MNEVITKTKLNFWKFNFPFFFLVFSLKSFQTLITKVEEIGQTQNAILELETKISQMEERTNTLDVEKVQNDLKEMKEENQRLMLKWSKSCFIYQMNKIESFYSRVKYKYTWGWVYLLCSFGFSFASFWLISSFSKDFPSKSFWDRSKFDFSVAVFCLAMSSIISWFNTTYDLPNEYQK